MHLLATEPGIIADGSAAVDLARRRATSSCWRAPIPRSRCSRRRRRGGAPTDPAAPTLRLAPVMRLGHNFSVDLYMETVARARLVIARLLGGSAYWPYGVERLVETCRDNGIPLALLPGDDKPDPELARSRPCRPRPAAGCGAIWRKAGRATPRISCAMRASLIGARDRSMGASRRRCCAPGCIGPAGDAEPRRDRRRMAGRGRGRPDRVLSGAGAVRQHGAGRCAGAGAGRARAAAAAGLRAAASRSARPPRCSPTRFAAHPPAVILNATGFSLAASGRRAIRCAPIARCCRSSSPAATRKSWRDGTRGLGPRDLAMNVALPEIDGRILSRAVSFKAPLGRDAETEADLVGYRAGRRPRRLCRRSRAQLGAAARASRRPSAGSRSCSPTTRTATAASATASGSIRRHRRSRSCSALREAGYRTGDVPDGRRRADRAAARRPDQRAAATRRPRKRCPSPSIRRSSPRLPHAGAAAGVGALGRAPSAIRSSVRGGSIAAGSRSPASASAMSRC